MTTKTKTLRSPGLRRLEEIVLSGAENAAIIVHPRICDATDLGATIRDIGALANSRVQGQRFLVFGVARDGESVAVTGLSDAEHAFGAKLERLAARYFEPQLRLRYVRWRVQSQALGVLLIEGCEDAPYLIRKDVLPVTHVGDAWIRRRGRSIRMRRGELDRLYTERFAGPLYDGHIKIQFAGETPSEFIRLAATNTTELPSHIAAEQIEALINARQLAMNAASNQLTYIGRISQARIMGCDASYADKGLATLKMELAKVAEAYRIADDRFRFEKQAHSVNLQLALDGDCDIECASLVMHIPADLGIRVLMSLPGETDELPGAPHIEYSSDVFRISENYERLHAKRRSLAFRQPLRIVVDAHSGHRKIPVYYRLQGRNLRYPVSGKLYIVCAV